MNTLKGAKPTIYSWDELYHQGDTDPNLVIPAVKSIVVDDRDPENVHFRYVTKVHEDGTFELGAVKAEALSPDFSSDDDDTGWNISDVDYGNNRFYLYFTEEEINQNGGFKLTVDKRIVVPGNDVSDFQIVKLDENGNYQPISMSFDSSGVYKGTRIPLNEVSDNMHVPTNCHTVNPMENNDVYRLIVFDYAGTQTGEYKLFAKRAIINNNAVEDSMIVGFILEGTQQDQHGFYLLPGQDKDALVVMPMIVFNDGRKVNIPIDGATTELYGLEEFIASSPGQETEILVKYWLHPDDQAYGNFVHVVDDKRYLAVTEKLRVIDIPDSYNCKISVVPRFNYEFSKWYLTFFLYTLGSDTVRNVTPLINIEGFDGDNYTEDQEIVISFDMSEVFDDITVSKDYNQYLKVRLAPPMEMEKYILQSSPNDIYGFYGVDTPEAPRPIITYDQLAAAYKVPNTIFYTEDMFLESFYYKARPLYESSAALEPIKPTHFTVRDPASNAVILDNPIELINYSSDWSINTVLSDALVNKNCIIEFLKEDGDGVYKVLYGVPVDVVLESNLPQQGQN